MSEAREVNQLELSEILGLSVRQIHNLEQEGMPSRAKGKNKLYPIPAAVKWYVRYKEDRATKIAPATTYEDAQARHESAKASLAELKLAEAEGKVISIEEMEKMLSEPLYRLRAKLLTMPSKWSPMLVGCRTISEAQLKLEAAVHEAMISLSEDEDNYDYIQPEEEDDVQSP